MKLLSKGFTLIELVVVISIIAVLSAIILFTVTQYVSKGKDSNISANLAILIPAGEAFYNGNGNSYSGFCDPRQNSVIRTAMSQMPAFPTPDDCENGLTPGVCCYVATPNYDAWAACAQEFTNSLKAYCVDSRGFKEEICNKNCTNTLTQCPDPSTQTSCSS